MNLKSCPLHSESAHEKGQIQQGFNANGGITAMASKLSGKLILGTIRQWHWVSSAVSLLAMLLFAFTGFTLNHAADISADIQVVTIEAELPQELIASLAEIQEGPLPVPLRRWLRQHHDLHFSASVTPEWSEDEIYLQIPRPGGDAWMSIDLISGELLYELTQRGAIAYLNDLHKGRNTGQAWFWFIDVFAIACVVFCVTGLILLYRQANPRPSTWPMVGLGVVVPLLLIILFVHP